MLPYVLLYAILLGAKAAHARYLVVTSLLLFAGVAQGSQIQKLHSRQNMLSLDDSVFVETSSSVVQDWSLVCKQLCGAGLGGVPCASICTTNSAALSKQQLAFNLLHPNKILICQDLCKLQLGDDVCDCKRNTAIKPISEKELNGVCDTFCTYNKATLTGCSLCQQVTLSDIQQRIGDEKPLLKVQRDTEEAEAAADDTTPDWNELCVSLCKTGDGGSLCNCDLSPFFFK
ncbi:uncharacterized protein LOC119667903 [Teleopsis dalmanni]|uniref:uncharacterized protein LOC119667903 n=1 Tax=Teleopsis dalmanni TaxID=139649 RepID=UPI0018CCEFC5|nr:uncharacterized protein LOC119667903 [Teleopsis dalmanni]